MHRSSACYAGLELGRYREAPLALADGHALAGADPRQVDRDFGERGQLGGVVDLLAERELAATRSASFTNDGFGQSAQVRRRPVCVRCSRLRDRSTGQAQQPSAAGRVGSLEPVRSLPHFREFVGGLGAGRSGDRYRAPFDCANRGADDRSGNDAALVQRVQHLDPDGARARAAGEHESNRHRLSRYSRSGVPADAVLAGLALSALATVTGCDSRRCGAIAWCGVNQQRISSSSLSPGRMVEFAPYQLVGALRDTVRALMPPQPGASTEIVVMTARALGVAPPAEHSGQSDESGVSGERQ